MAFTLEIKIWLQRQRKKKKKFYPKIPIPTPKNVTFSHLLFALMEQLRSRNALHLQGNPASGLWGKSQKSPLGGWKPTEMVEQLWGSWMILRRTKKIMDQWIHIWYLAKSQATCSSKPPIHATESTKQNCYDSYDRWLSLPCQKPEKKKLGVFFPKRLNNRKAALNNRNVPTPRIPGEFFFDSQTASLSSGSTGVVFAGRT